jgi:hypothetical protein
MKINNTQLANIGDKLNSNALNMSKNPIDSSIGLMENKNELTMATKVIKAKDEMLGTILDIKA